MALPANELEALRDALLRVRAAGARAVQMDGKRVEYANDAEMAKAIADLETRIRRASTLRPGGISFSTSKGM